MNWLMSLRKKNGNSNIKIYHNAQFPLNDILDILYPLFGMYYSPNSLASVVHSANNIFCAYDKSQGRCIACAIVNNAPGGLYIMLFGVQQLNQSRGTGTHLLESIIQWARHLGYAYIYLDVHIGNFKAIGLYEKVGFIKYKYLPNHYSTLPKYPPHAFRMVLWLQS